MVSIIYILPNCELFKLATWWKFRGRGFVQIHSAIY